MCQLPRNYKSCAYENLPPVAGQCCIDGRDMGCDPKLGVPDIDELSEFAHEAGNPLVAENTMGVVLVHPIEHGSDIGVAGSLVIDPATTTLQQLTATEQSAPGVTDAYVLLSVGLEDSSDILANIEQALQKAAGARYTAPLDRLRLRKAQL